MKIGCFLVCLFLCQYQIAIFGQDKEMLLKLNTEKFKKLIEKSPSIANKDLWGLFHQSAENAFLKENYKLAENYSDKAKIIADKLGDFFLLYKSNYQLGKVEISLQNDKEARNLFNIAYAYLIKEANKIAPQKIGVDKEAPLFFYYWALIDSNYGYLSPAFSRLWLAYSFHSVYPDKIFDDAFVLTSLQIARCFGMKGNHLAKLIWIEIAKTRFSESSEIRNQLLFQIFYESQDAYLRIGDNQSALNQFNKIEAIRDVLSSKSKLLYFGSRGDFNYQTQNKKLQDFYYNEGIKLAKKDLDNTELGDFYINKLFSELNAKNVEKAESYLKLIEELLRKNIYLNKIHIYAAKALIAGYKNDATSSKEYFLTAENLLNDWRNNWELALFLYSCETDIAKFQKNYENLKNISQKYIDIAFKYNNKTSFYMFMNLAEANKGLGNVEEAKKALQKAFSLAESSRKIDSPQNSIGVVERYYEAYQLNTEINLAENKSIEAFQSSEKLKGRFLADKIANNPLNQTVSIDPKLKTEIFNLTLQILKKPKDEKLFTQLSELEKKAIFYENQNNSTEAFAKVGQNIVADLEKSPIDNQTAVVSYVFTNDNNLNAFVWQKSKLFEVKQLPITKAEIDRIAIELPKKIKNFVFFKQEGKELYDKLLKPLDLQAKHLIIVPDKSLWKIPFQALNEDGKTYLIENKTISYAPSVSILLNQLNNPTPQRQTFQVFSNALYNNLYLLYADAEANKLAKLFGVQPHLNSTSATFAGVSDKSDIVHFSMHAEADNEEAFNSFLAFKPIGKDDGKLTVDELLKMKLKKGSLAFLASCETNNVFNGEGLVSLAWGMMGAGASTVISAQWEANDKSTGQFTQAFYKNYKQGISSSEAMQKASIEMIKSNLNEPYYWAEFTLNGDYR